MSEEAIEKVKAKRIIGYYDLIELPSGRHIPIPIALRLVGLEEVVKIPVSNRKRGEYFYFCPKCDEICRECNEEIGGYIDCEYECDIQPFSFYRCTLHRPLTEVESRAKEIIFEIMVKLGFHEFLKYIEADLTYNTRKGWIEVEEVKP